VNNNNNNPLAVTRVNSIDPTVNWSDSKRFANRTDRYADTGRLLSALLTFEHFPVAQRRMTVPAAVGEGEEVITLRQGPGSSRSASAEEDSNLCIRIDRVRTSRLASSGSPKAPIFTPVGEASGGRPLMVAIALFN
jgi:hypothetical protein